MAETVDEARKKAVENARPGYEEGIARDVAGKPDILKSGVFTVEGSA